MKRRWARPQGLCESCGSAPQAVVREIRKRSRGKVYPGPFFKRTCETCSKSPYRRHLSDRCALCGFVPAHRCQLDVDHIDGNHGNDDPGNLQTLCANCHRLKTYRDQIQNVQAGHPKSGEVVASRLRVLRTPDRQGILWA